MTGTDEIAPREPIIPEPINLDATTPGYAPGHWNYPQRCAKVELALDSARERVEEWDLQDGHGWWHERPDWIALHNEVLRLRHALKTGVEGVRDE
jgi:hypothetical protein